MRHHQRAPKRVGKNGCTGLLQVQHIEIIRNDKEVHDIANFSRVGAINSRAYYGETESNRSTH